MISCQKGTGSTKNSDLRIHGGCALQLFYRSVLCVYQHEYFQLNCAVETNTLFPVAINHL